MFSIFANTVARSRTGGRLSNLFRYWLGNQLFSHRRLSYGLESDVLPFLHLAFLKSFFQYVQGQGWDLQHDDRYFEFGYKGRADRDVIVLPWLPL